MENIHAKNCVIIGGGISGLIAATRLQQAGLKVTVLDKGRGIGGRLATRRIQDTHAGEGVFDYGAQFFTVQQAAFQQWVSEWKRNNIVQQWSDKFVVNNARVKQPNTVFYRGTVSMRDIAKQLAAKLTVHTSTQIVKIAWKANQWTAHSDAKEAYTGDIILLTPPVPQILELLNNSKLTLPEDILSQLENVTYQRCIAALVLQNERSTIPEPGGMWMDGEPIQWIADNGVKGISPNGYAVTIHAGPEFSLRHWDWSDEKIFERLITAAQPLLHGEIVEYQIHRWRYSQPIQSYGQPFLYLPEPGPMVFAGDGFVGNRVESAALSGIRAAEFIASNLKE
ncbi:MAG: NAD(P)/FAD-dependent oxidoreductase [Candidatus Zhuqueibacterota bacterium]